MNTTLLILYLEDSLIDAELIREALANEDILCEMLHVETQMEFLTAIERQDFDLILADYSLPGFNGLSALKLAREYCPNTPFIFVTGTMGEEIAVESLKCGATDYVLKQNLARLVPVVQRALQESEDRKERKRMQEALRETNERLQAFIQASPLAIIALEPEGSVTLWNPAAERMFGWQEGDVLGQFLPIVPEDKHDEYRILRERVLQGEALTNIETIRRKKDGTSIDISISTAPLRDAQERITGIMGVVADITERKQAEAQIKAALAEKEMLLRELYHRTKNNMQVIRSMLILRAASCQNAEINAFVEEIEQKILTMALVHQKLYQSQDLSRISLDEYLGELIALLIQSYTPTSHKIALRSDLKPVSVLIDIAIPCGLIVNELLSNALRHAFPDERVGEIRIHLSRTPTGMIELSFADNGIGVPHTFDFRAQPTLGLQTILALVEQQLQGDISWETQRGIAYTIRFHDNFYTSRV